LPPFVYKFGTFVRYYSNAKYVQSIKTVKMFVMSVDYTEALNSKMNIELFLYIL